MTRFNAHALFCVRPDGGRSLLHPRCDEDTAPTFCVALASLSGMLDDAETQADLDEAVAHAMTLLSIGTVSEMDLDHEVRDVFDEIATWGEQVESERN